MRLWVFCSASALLTLCALVFAWQISATALLGITALILDGLPLSLQVAGTMAMVLPAIYTAVAVITFLGRSRRRW
jgi:hypothetical protein